MSLLFRLRTALAAALLLALASPSAAAPIQLQGVGSVVAPPTGGSVDPNFTLGERVEVTVTIESDAIPSGPGIFDDGLVSIVVDFTDSGRSFSFGAGPVVVVNDLFGIDSFSVSSEDAISVSELGGIAPDTLQLDWIDGAGAMLISTALPLSDLAWRLGQLTLTGPGLAATVHFEPVPEPGLAALLTLGIAAAAIRRRNA